MRTGYTYGSDQIIMACRGDIASDDGPQIQRAAAAIRKGIEAVMADVAAQFPSDRFHFTLNYDEPAPWVKAENERLEREAAVDEDEEE